MRIIFIGSVQFSEKAMLKLIKIKADVVGVCTLKKSTFNADHVDLSPMCRENNIPVTYANDINSKENIQWIKSHKPDVIFCFGWSRLIKKELLNLAPLGVLGYHPTALPLNRGRHPLIWALVLGLDQTASTFFFMDEGADSGDILSQEPITISKSDNARSLYKKVVDVGLKQLEKFLPGLESGDFKRLPQDSYKANIWRKRGARDGEIDWRMSAESIHNLVRGLSKPYFGAHFLIEGKQIKVWETEVVFNNEKNIEPGKVLFFNKEKPIIKTGENSIKLLEIEPIIKFKQGTYL